MAQHGSLINQYASTNVTIPEVGMGCTIVGWSDRTPATVIEVSPTGHRIVVQQDIATRTDSNGMSDAQSYTFQGDPNGVTRTYTRRRDGNYRAQGGDGKLLLGVRDRYYDYSF